MGKIIAIIGVILFVWVMYPHARRGEWVAPTAIAPNTWMSAYLRDNDRALLATPPQGYGWFHFDFWNGPTTTPGRPVMRDDFHL